MSLALGQSVVISESESTPDASSILDLQSTSKGVLIPRMTEVDRGIISSPAPGLLVYQTDGASGFYFYSGTAWIALIAGQEEDPLFDASQAASITDAGSGQVITDTERTNLQNAILSNAGFPSMTYSEKNSLSDTYEGMIIYQTDNTPGLRSYNGADWSLLREVYTIVKDLKNDGINGGTPPLLASWFARELNTIEGDASMLTLNSNQLTLSPGRYLVEAMAPVHQSDNARLRLYDTTNDETLIFGRMEFENSSQGFGITYTEFLGEVTLSAATTLEIQQWINNISPSNGLGIAISADGLEEVYTTVKITKIAD